MKLKFGSWSLTPYLMVVLFLGLQACGGGSAPPPSDQNASGIYTGTGTVNSVTTSDFRGIIYNNRFMIFNVSENVVYDGTITNVTLSDMTATADVYDAGVRTQTGVNVTATITTESQIQSFTISGTGKGSATFDLTYDSAYKSVTATKARINSEAPNEWTGNVYNLIATQTTTNLEQFDTGTPTYDFTTGSTGVNCGYEGDFTHPTDVNVYPTIMTRVTTSDTACTVDTSASYSGLASVLTTTNTDDTLWYVVTNGVHSVVALLTH